MAFLGMEGQRAGETAPACRCVASKLKLVQFVLSPPLQRGSALSGHGHHEPRWPCGGRSHWLHEMRLCIAIFWSLLGVPAVVGVQQSQIINAARRSAA